MEWPTRAPACWTRRPAKILRRASPNTTKRPAHKNLKTLSIEIHENPEHIYIFKPWKRSLLKSMKTLSTFYFQNPGNALLLKTWKPWKRYILILLWNNPRIFSFGNHAILEYISSLITLKCFLKIFLTTLERFSFQTP